MVVKIAWAPLQKRYLAIQIPVPNHPKVIILPICFKLNCQQKHLQLIASGVIGENGDHARKSVVVAPKGKLGSTLSQLYMEEKTARVQHQSSEIATWQNAQV